MRRWSITHHLTVHTGKCLKNFMRQPRIKAAQGVMTLSLSLSLLYKPRIIKVSSKRFNICLGREQTFYNFRLPRKSSRFLRVSVATHYRPKIDIYNHLHIINIFNFNPAYVVCSTARKIISIFQKHVKRSEAHFCV